MTKGKQQQQKIKNFKERLTHSLDVSKNRS